MKKLYVLLLLAALSVCGAVAQTKDSVLVRYKYFVAKGDSAYKGGEYASGASWYLQALALDNKRTGVIVRTACCYSLNGQVKEANDLVMQIMNLNWEQGCRVVNEKKDLAAYRSSRYWQAIAPECEALLDAFESSPDGSSGGVSNGKNGQ